MKTRLLSLIAYFLVGVIAALSLPPRMASAQLVVACANCNNEFTQVAMYAKEIDQFLQMVQSYENEVAMYQNMVVNTTQLPHAYYDRAIQLVRNAENILQNGTNINYAMGNLNVRFGSMYPSYNTLLANSQYATNQSLFNDYQSRSQQTYDAALTALQAAQAHSQEMSAEQSMMDSNGSLLRLATGRMDAMQAAGVYAQHTAQQLMKLRELTLIQIQLQAQAQANQQREIDTDRANFERYLAPGIPASIDTSHPDLW